MTPRYRYSIILFRKRIYSLKKTGLLSTAHAKYAFTKDKSMEFHEKLQKLRKSKGLTQEELACALYVSRAAVSKWESGRGYPNMDSLRAISAYF